MFQHCVAHHRHAYSSIPEEVLLCTVCLCGVEGAAPTQGHSMPNRSLPAGRYHANPGVPGTKASLESAE